MRTECTAKVAGLIAELSRRTKGLVKSTAWQQESSRLTVTDGAEFSKKVWRRNLGGLSASGGGDQKVGLWVELGNMNVGITGMK